MPSKILFTDMDGTLLTSDKKVSPSLCRLLTKMVKNGGRLVLSSGRTLPSIIQSASRAGLLFPDTLIIAANGNLVYDYDSKQTLMEKNVPMDICRGIIQMADQIDLHIQSYTDTQVVCKRERPEIHQYCQATGMSYLLSEDIMSAVGHAPNKLIAIDLHDKAKLERFQAAVLEAYGDTVTAIFSNDNYLEIFDKTAGKGNALRFVCDYLDIPVSASVAAGDAENDITMLQAAGIGAAMANADEAVKRCADFITSADNDHDGLSEVILKFFYE